VERATGSGVGHGEQHAAGAGLGGIMRAMDSWLNRNEFSKPGGARLEVMVDLGKIGQNLVQSRGEADPVGTCVRAKRFLQQTKEPARAWECNGHGAKFSQDAVPLCDGHSSLMWGYAGQEFGETGRAAGREG